MRMPRGFLLWALVLGFPSLLFPCRRTPQDRAKATAGFTAPVRRLASWTGGNGWPRPVNPVAAGAVFVWLGGEERELPAEGQGRGHEGLGHGRRKNRGNRW